MARTVTPLTDKKIKDATPKDKTYTHFDGGGLFIEITPKGQKWWRIKYTFNGKSYRKGLGVYPAVSLKMAREKRQQIKEDIYRGIDPFSPVVEEILGTTREITFKEAAEMYQKEILSTKSDKHQKRTIDAWGRDLYTKTKDRDLPDPEAHIRIGDSAMNDIQTDDVIRIMKSMRARGQRNKSRGGLADSAEKLLTSMSLVYQYIMNTYDKDSNFAKVTHNPCRDVKLKFIFGDKKVRNYPIITDRAGLSALLKSIDEYVGHPSTRLGLKFIAYTAVRPGNIRSAAWEDINFETKQWLIPASKMKTSHELIVPLTDTMIEILKEAKIAADGSPLLFPSPKGKAVPISDGTMINGLRRMGYTSDEIVAHSFRGIFATLANEHSGFERDVIDLQLAHTVGSQSSQAYNRADRLTERTKLMQWYSTYLQNIQ